MAMNFWEAQRRARSKTSLYVMLFILLTLIVAVISEFVMHYFAQNSYHPPFPIVGPIFVALTFAVALYQYAMFRLYGGRYVAESVGAHLVDPTTKDPEERQLLNIVEEIALASALPTPPVYILETGQINAFAAGLSKDNAAITVTRGSLQTLSRDELQGVVAHEFGHIYNQDMKISMRLAAMVMGFFFVIYLAIRLLQISGFSSRNNRRGQGGVQGGQGGNPLQVAALVLLAAGALTWFFGSILKAAVSREREYLADACAVQFTRNSQGIAGALKKIMAETNKDMPKTGMAISHLYIDDRSPITALFATHPPLEKRIAAIQGGVYIPEEWKTRDVIQKQF